MPLKIGGIFTSCPECDDIVEAFEDIPTPETNDEGVPFFFTNWGFDEGTATHFGKFTTIYRIDFFEDGTAEGHFILIAEDGSEIYGTNTFTPAGVRMFDYTATFSGGTGRFKDVEADVEGTVVALDAATLLYEGGGTIDNLGRVKAGKKQRHSERKISV